MLTILITIIHVLVCFFLILVVLAQQGKGQDLASAFGGTGSQTAFGARGTATLLSKITAGAAMLFVVTSLSLSYLKPVVSSDSVIPESAAPASTEPASEEPSAEEGAAAQAPAEAAPAAEAEAEPEAAESEEAPPPEQ